jgi:TRAP-type C4-dicarboxylate transport system permease small subunit
MRALLSKIYDLAGYAAGASVVAIFLVMISATVLREIGVASGGTDDIVAWLAAAAALLAMAHTFQHGDMVRMTLILERLPAPARRWAEVLALSVGTISCIYLAWWVSVSVHQSWMLEDMSNGLIVVPLWIPQLILVFGALLLAVALLDELLWVLAGNVPRYVSAVKTRHASGDFGEGV